MQKNKITIVLVVLIIVATALGIFFGMKDYKQNAPVIEAKKNEQCIITIQGSQYDVSEFRSKHTGGDVFKCGEDMTESFTKKHKGYLPMIEKFKIN